MHKLSFKGLRTVAALALSATLLAGLIPTNTVQAAPKKATDKTANEVVTDMSVGWNLGNTLDSKGDTFPATSSNEEAWGNPKATKELIQAVGAAGFNTIRIPVSWGQYTKGPNYKIPKFFMSRVKEVVDYCIDNGMYVILNSHHDEDFYAPTNKKKAESEKFFACIWKQIAKEFKNYDSHLVFETINEPRLVGHPDEWWFPRDNPSDDVKEAIACINDYNQVALDAIRATGGKNKTRCVMVPGYDASYDGSMIDLFKLPKDSASNRLIVSVHAYTPYDFTLNKDGTDQFTDKASLDSIFSDLGSKYLSKGTPVVIGEMGASNKHNTAERVKWADYYWGLAEQYKNVAMCIWDNGVLEDPDNCGECHQYIDRTTLKWMFPEIIDTIMKHVDGTPAKSDHRADAKGLKVGYELNDWGSGFIYTVEVKNEGPAVDTWKIRVKKSDIKIDISWCVHVKEDGDDYVLTPYFWNAHIEKGQSVKFGLQGTGNNHAKNVTFTLEK